MFPVDWEPIVPLVLSVVACVFAFRAWYILRIMTLEMVRGLKNLLEALESCDQELEK